MRRPLVYGVYILSTNPIEGSTLSRALHYSTSRKEAYIVYMSLRGIINVPDVSIKLMRIDPNNCSSKLLSQIDSPF